jgi:hypothetical protein
MADPKITLKWADNNADETGHRILITSEPWNRGAPATTIKDVASDLTTADLTLAEVNIEPAFLKVAALRGTEVKVSVESALAIKTPVIAGGVFDITYEMLAELPYTVALPEVTKGTLGSYPLPDDYLDPSQGFTVTPDGLLLQIFNNKICTLNPATGAMKSVPLPGGGINQIGSAVCMAHDGNAYVLGRHQGNPSVYRYKMDEEAPEVVYSWAYGSGPGSELNPSNIKQGTDGRLYMFGGYKFVTTDNKLVVNSILIDGTDPRTDLITIPAGFGTGAEVCLFTPNNKLIVWVPGKDEVLCYDPATQTVTPYTGNTNLNMGDADRPASRRIMAPLGKYGALIAGNGIYVCKFQYENNVSQHINLPADFITSHPLRDLYESCMGWTFASNTSGDICVSKSDGTQLGTIHEAATVGMADVFNGPSFARIGKTVYVIGTGSTDMKVCPFHINSLWQSCNSYDAASMINTSARGQNS